MSRNLLALVEEAVTEAIAFQYASWSHRATESRSRMLRVLQDQPRLVPVHDRPKTRADCSGVPRPCPYVGCKYNTYLEVKKNGSILFRKPGLEPDEVDPLNSCVLDIIDRSGSVSCEEAGEALGVTRHQVASVEMDVLGRLRNG